MFWRDVNVPVRDVSLYCLNVLYVINKIDITVNKIQGIFHNECSRYIFFIFKKIIYLRLFSGLHTELRL